MRIQSSISYNSLGKIGPHYERPEYPPPQPPAVGEENAPATRGDKKTLSTKNNDAAQKKAAANQPAPARLNLGSAQSLVAATCGLIQSLPPQSNAAPHQNLPTGLMTPVYV